MNAEIWKIMREINMEVILANRLINIRTVTVGDSRSGYGKI